jgi:hypothetical protein
LSTISSAFSTNPSLSPISAENNVLPDSDLQVRYAVEEPAFLNEVVKSKIHTDKKTLKILFNLYLFK